MQVPQTVQQQFGTQAMGWRFTRAFAGVLAAITALGHFPGFDPDTGALLPLGDTLFEWVGVLGVFMVGLLTGGKRGGNANG